MKKIIFISISLLIIGIFSGCEVTDVDINGRIENFEDDLNSSDRTGIWNNFSSSETQTYDAINEVSYWDGVGLWQQSNRDFSLEITSSSDDTANVTISHAGGTLHSRFDMVAEVNGFTTTWYIQSIYINELSDYEIRKISK